MTADKVGELEALLADLRTDDPRPRFAGTLEIRCTNFLRNNGGDMLRIYRAWQVAAVSTVQENRGYMKDCSYYAPAPKTLDKQRVRLVPDDGQGA